MREYNISFRSALMVFMLLILMLGSGEELCAGQRVFRISDGKTISFEQMMDDLRKDNLVLVGESHNMESHHRLQLDIIKALNAAKIPLAVGFEMFTADSQDELNKWVAGSLPLEEFVRLYYKNWGFPWPLYEHIFLYMRDNGIPAIGLNVPAGITRKISKYGFSSLTKEELKKLPLETGCAVDEQYMKFIRRAYAMHGHSGGQFIHFCEAQLIWDQVMARNIVEYIKNNPGRTVVALAGNGHAWKRGIPEQVHSLSDKIRCKVILPEIRGYIDPDTITAEDADYIMLK
jgi:uncharacterized iron-regulated protein